jgi:glycolate oxidase FAD binding subunit
MRAPETEDAVAEIVRQAHAARSPLAIEGMGSKRGMLRPVQAAETLSTRNLTGITLNSPGELVLSARAGTPVAEIEAALAANNQQLTAEPPDLSALLGTEAGQSIGGVIATNLSGPRRIAWGAMRDHLLGARAVNGAGEVFHSGGRVIKNVTGLDLCKLLAGSHGTLGVITEVTLKVLPRPESSGSLVLHRLTAEQGVAALAAGLGSPYGVSGAAFLPPAAAEALGLPARSATILRIEESEPSVAYRLGRLREALAHFGGVELLREEESTALWAGIRDVRPISLGEGEALWLLSTRPSRGPGVLGAVEAAGGRGFLDWGGGRIWAAGPGTEAMARAVAGAIGREGGTFMLLRGPEHLRLTLPVVPPEPPALATLSDRVKAVLDPARILNPGRLSASL